MIEREDIAKLIKERYKLSDIQVTNVLEYAYSLSEARDKPNDYAIAKEINLLVTGIFAAIADISRLSPTPDIDLTKLNRSYILLVNELVKIYDRNPELSEITPTPAWKHFDTIEGRLWDINQYEFEYRNDGYGQAHNAKVNRLCIINGKETADLTQAQQTIVNDGTIAFAKISAFLNNLTQGKEVCDWYIPEYYVERSKNGIITINGKLALRKPNTGSFTDMLMDFAVRNDNKDASIPTTKDGTKIATNRPYITSLGELGFDKTLRALFFPIANKDKGIAFRSRVSRAVADSENIDTSKLDYKLKDLGVDVIYDDDKPIDLSQIPF